MAHWIPLSVVALYVGALFALTWWSQKLTERSGGGVITYLLALSVQGILKVLLTGLSISSAYALIALMTIYCPRLCRRSSASATLATTMLALALWLIAPPGWRLLPHPIYLTWLVSLLTFFAAAAIDRRHIEAPGTCV
ncbi:MAG: hypothetical protein JXR83_17155 [Deltaproteobacteria bacterium]|nr:hypothetical protein [Deltaproteobacteria bacterium]